MEQEAFGLTFLEKKESLGFVKSLKDGIVAIHLLCSFGIWARFILQRNNLIMPKNYGILQVDNLCSQWY